MLSALIPSKHSYPAIHLVAKPVDQRFVQPSPLVLRPTPLKYQTPVTDRDQPVSRMLSHVLLRAWTIPLSQKPRENRHISRTILVRLRFFFNEASLYGVIWRVCAPKTSLGVVLQVRLQILVGVLRYESILLMSIT